MENQGSAKVENKSTHSHSSNHHHHHHRHHHDGKYKMKYVTSYSDYNSGKKHRHYYHSDSSSKRESKGINIEYQRVKAERVRRMIKRCAFSGLMLMLICFVIYSIFTDPFSEKSKYNNTNQTETVEELNMKIADLEAEIYRLEQKLREYENSDK